MSVGIPAFFDAPPVVFACCIIKRPMTFEAVISVGYDSLEQPPREIHADKRSLQYAGNPVQRSYIPIPVTGRAVTMLALRQSAGTALTERSPHSILCSVRKFIVFAACFRLFSFAQCVNPALCRALRLF